MNGDEEWAEPKETDALLIHHTSLDDNVSSESEDEQDYGLLKSVTKKVKYSLRRMNSNIAQSPAVLREEYLHVKDTLRDTLEEADEADDFFLDMGLTKNLSLLPSQRDIKHTLEEVKQALRKTAATTAEPEEQEQEEVVVEKPEHTPLSAYLTLASAVTALSSIGPFLAKQENVDATMKIVWRFQGTALLLLPLAIRILLLQGWPRLSYAQWCTFGMAAASYAVLCVAFAMSINYTSVANATILTNSQSVLLVAGKLLVGNPVVFLEGFGVLVAFTGAVLCSKDSSATAKEMEQGPWLSLWGDCLGIFSSIGGIGYIVLGKSLRSTMPVLIFMVLNMTVASFIILTYMWVIGQEYSWDRHINHGVWGWMNSQSDRLPLEIATVVVCNLMGTMGYVRAFKYFSSIVIAVAALMEPVVASFTAVAMSVGVLPGLEGWIGNFLVAAGTLAVLYPSIEQP